MGSKDDRKRKKDLKREEKKRQKRSIQDTKAEYSETERKSGRVQLYLVGLITVLASAFIFFNMK
ncbi:MAG: hypothetical protein HN509_13910 [Halobacteriovoraceae bacterium]|jgi:hypothetical protein|nr:hypothetical protein [Halobacteriovoraceae bacterium]